MAAWRTGRHLEDHFGIHRREFPGFSIEPYDESAQETISLGNRFTYRDPVTRERRVGYFHRDSARFVAVDLDGTIRSHFHTDEAHIAELPASTYQDSGGDHGHIARTVRRHGNARGCIEGAAS